MKDMQAQAIQTQLMFVTPDMARDWLEKNTKNRNISERMIDNLVREINEGRWQLTHQGVAFYANGTLADGQHRLHAIAKAGIPVFLNVTIGLSDESLLAIDQHRMRGVADVVKLSGLANWFGKSEISVLRMYILLSSGDSKKSTAIHSPMQLIERAETVKEYLMFTRHLLSSTKIKGVTTAPVAAAFSLAMPHEDNDRLIDFAEVMKSGMASGDADSAAIRLREWLMTDPIATISGTTGRISVAKRTQRAIKAFCDRRPIKKLIEPQGLIYPVPNKLKSFS